MDIKDPPRTDLTIDGLLSPHGDLDHLDDNKRNAQIHGYVIAITAISSEAEDAVIIRGSPMSTALTLPEQFIVTGQFSGTLPFSRKVTERMELTEPALFFCRLHEIESKISSEALSIFAARKWQGSLGHREWQEAERRLLHPLEIRRYIEGQAEVLEFDIHGYSVRDIALHVEGDLLCLCASRVDHRGQQRMSSLKLRLSFPVCRDQLEVWRDGDSVFLRAPSSGAIPGSRTPPATRLPIVREGQRDVRVCTAA